MPFLPFDPSEVPVYPVLGTTNCFVFDDTQIDYSLLDELRSLISANTPDPTGGGDTNADGGTPDPPWNGPYYSSTDFWLELLSVDTVNQNSFLTLHGTKQGFYYELLQRLDLLRQPGWIPSPVLVIYDSNGTNQVYFDPAPNGGRPITFYRGVQGFPVVSIVTDRYHSVAIESNSATGDPGTVAIFNLSLSDKLSSNLAVVYSISGSASNGVDYTNLSGTITFPAGTTVTNIVVQPYEDNIVEFEESVILTLTLTNGYLIDPAAFSATVYIIDNYTNGTPFSTVTNLDSPVGIDYSPPLQSLIVSVHEATDGETNNFVRLYTNVANQLAVTNWSGVHGAPNEVKLATVKSTIGGFTNGDVFFGSDTNVGWVSADGTTSNLTWCTLTNAAVTNAQVLRGGLYVDQTGVWSNNLIAIASDQNYVFDDKGVWRVDGQRNPTLIANIKTYHLEGAITLPNTNTWGPWAGKIITGDEGFFDELGRSSPIIYSIDTNGIVAAYSLGIAPEDFDIIPANQDLYCTFQDSATIAKLPSALFSNFVGDLLITQEGSYYGPGTLFIVHWDSSASNFLIRSITTPNGEKLEHVTFAPIHLPSTPITP
jgi:hypothetical protein